MRLTNEQLREAYEDAVGSTKDCASFDCPECGEANIKYAMASELLARRKLDDLFAEWCREKVNYSGEHRLTKEECFGFFQSRDWWREHLKEAGCGQ